MSMYQEHFPHLFAPLTVGTKKKHVFKNRIFATPMIAPGAFTNDYNGVINEFGVEYYTNFARGGFASCCIPMEVPRDSGHIGSMALDEPHKGFIFMHLAQRAIHAFRCNTFVEIYHPGLCMLPGFGQEIISASPLVYNGKQVRGMNEDDMASVTAMYVQAALDSKRAGFDGICLHYAHGWLMNNFLSPLSNKRTDQYGGSVENRCRFPLHVLKSVREAVGDDMVIEIRMNGSDRAEGGIVPEDAAQQALIFQDYADMIHISCGTRLDALARPKMHPTCFVPPAHNLDGAIALKKAGVKIPVGLVGQVHDAVLAERLIAEGHIDYMLMGRQAVADPEWPNKVREGRLEDIRPCIHCDYCTDGGRRTALTTSVSINTGATFDSRCSVNPEFGQGMIRTRFFRDGKKKKVAVVGGGVAGMEAAVTAAARGHSVTLFEKGAALGGQLRIFPEHLWFKKELLRFREYLITQVSKSNVEVRLNTQVQPAQLAEEGYDAVIVAVGAQQRRPPIPGIDGKNVTMAWDVFGHEDRLGHKIVIVGGGAVGCEMSIQLGGDGHEVTLLEMSPYYAATSEISERMSFAEFMEKNHVDVRLNTLCMEITPSGVLVEHDGVREEIPADSVIVSAGSRSLDDERDSFNGVAMDVIPVGDCVRASNIRNAVDTAWCAANTL